MILKRPVWGVSLGGAIIQDKLFFFAAYEDFTEPYNTLRGPVGSGAANTATVTQADIDEVVRLARELYGVDAGQWNINNDQKDKKLLAKLDWNINDDHRFSFTYQNTGGLMPLTLVQVQTLDEISLDTNFYNNQQDFALPMLRTYI
ncbi:hypothetical protein [Alishewanella longhuensis]